MRETNTNQDTCQAPNLRVLDSKVSQSRLEAMKDLAASGRTLMPPPLWEAIKHLNLLEAKEKYCTDPEHCGHSMLGKYDGTTIVMGGVQICRNHNCPVTQLVKAYRLVMGIASWMQIYSVEVRDQSYTERKLRKEARELGIPGRRIPTNHETAIILSPAPLTGSVPYTGDTWALYQLVVEIPEGKNITTLKPKGERDHNRGTNAEDAEAEGKSGIPLVGKPAYFSTPLSTEELSVACGEAGFPLSYNQADQLTTPPAETLEETRALSDLFEAIRHPEDSFRLRLKMILKQQSAGIGPRVAYPILGCKPKRPTFRAKRLAQAA